MCARCRTRTREYRPFTHVYKLYFMLSLQIVYFTKKKKKKKKENTLDLRTILSPMYVSSSE